MSALCRRRQLSTWPGCDCDDCRAITLRLHKLYRCGKITRIPPEVGVAVLDAMIWRRYSAGAIASAADVSDHTANGWRQLRIRAIPVRLGPGACRALVNAGQPTRGSITVIPSRRKLRALAKIGWSIRDLAEQCDLSTGTLSSIRTGETKIVRVPQATIIADMYRRLEMRPHDNLQARRNATRLRWRAPLDWDDIDDIAARPLPTPPRDTTEPDWVAVWQAMLGQRPGGLRHVDRVAIVATCIAAGWSHQHIEDVTGLNAYRYTVTQPQEVS